MVSDAILSIINPNMFEMYFLARFLEPFISTHVYNENQFHINSLENIEIISTILLVYIINL